MQVVELWDLAMMEVRQQKRGAWDVRGMSLAEVSGWVRQGRRPWPLVVLAVVILSLVTYANGLGGEYVIDDLLFMVDNPHLSAPHDIAYFFTDDVLSYSVSPSTVVAIYRPLFFATLWLGNAIGLGSPLALHLFALVLHIIATLLVLAVIVRLVPGVSVVAAAVGALAFAVHPVHSEAVAWIAAFIHPLATIFVLVSFLFYDMDGRLHKSVALALAGLFFALALFCNEVVTGFPFFLLGYTWLRYRPVQTLQVVPFFILLALYAVVRHGVLGEALPLTISDLDAWRRFPVFLIEYLRHLVFPWPQPFYPAGSLEQAMPPGWSLSWVSVLSVGLLAFFCGLALKRASADRVAGLLALAWIAAALMPVLAATFSPDFRFALRSLYLASVGLAVLVAWLLHSIAFPQKPAGFVVIALVLSLAMGATISANRTWQNNGRVFQQIVNSNPTNFVGYRGAGAYWELSGQPDRAIEYYERGLSAVRLEDRPALLERLGAVLGETGASQQSLEIFRQLTELEPDNSHAWVGIGNNLWALGQMDEAANAYKKAIAADSANWQACYNLVLLLRRHGKVQEAMEFSGCNTEPS